MGAFASLRKQHEPLAQNAFEEASAAFRQGKQDEGYAKYQEIVDKYYAASLYRNIKEQLKVAQVGRTGPARDWGRDRTRIARHGRRRAGY